MSPNPGIVERLRAATGGFPLYLGGLRGKTGDDLLAAAETSLEQMLGDVENALLDLGLGDQRLREIARFLLDQSAGRFEADDRDALVTLMEEDGARAAEQGLDVLEQIGVLDRAAAVDAPSGLQLNPLVARLLAARSTP